MTTPAGIESGRERRRCGFGAVRSQPTIAVVSASVACSQPTSTAHSTRNQRSRSYP
ncbi:hypothetical protein P3T27_005310 [Kitasatospora sp. MAA19]|uniref:hypothetical protein n=1 Tax=Kitasatospora sp. MAA19 TaxID=3035090 RepID=UPI0024764B48|nr:hypothetical protein [Kitasatospora sp. MAA19]MDH6708570.1 hypothetical protein [Kitasatospora sp. MAA19]